MSKSLVDALGNGAWSVSTVVFDLNDIVDDEGRPISERRADAAARVGVEMEMRACPYSGIRHGKQMNVSALVQISHYINPVLAEMSAFNRQVSNGNPVTWSHILAAIVDQLSGPAIYLLQHRSERGPVPAQMAVGHKLAAGFFGVLRGLHERLAQGVEIPVELDIFMDIVDETGALVGASEACAGSPPMIRKASAALIEANAEQEAHIDPLRMKIACCLAQQVQLGIFWQLYDKLHLWSLIRGPQRQHLAPFNDFLKRKLTTAEEGIALQAPPPPDVRKLPDVLEAQRREALSAALRDAADAQELEEDIRCATALLQEPGSAIRYTGDIPTLARDVANYLHTHRLFKDELSRLEQELRGYLNYPNDAPIDLGLAVFPRPQALPWYELIVGRKFGSDGHLSGSTTGVRVCPVSVV